MALALVVPGPAQPSFRGRHLVQALLVMHYRLREIAHSLDNHLDPQWREAMLDERSSLVARMHRLLGLPEAAPAVRARLEEIDEALGEVSHAAKEPMLKEREHLEALLSGTV